MSALIIILMIPAAYAVVTAVFFIPPCTDWDEDNPDVIFYMNQPIISDFGKKEIKQTSKEMHRFVTAVESIVLNARRQEKARSAPPSWTAAVKAAKLSLNPLSKEKMANKLHNQFCSEWCSGVYKKGSTYSCECDTVNHYTNRPSFVQGAIYAYG